MLLDEAMEPMALPFSLLEKITNGFAYKQEIGKGGFSDVYKVYRNTPNCTSINSDSLN
jgi:hypothetical protein